MERWTEAKITYNQDAHWLILTQADGSRASYNLDQLIATYAMFDHVHRSLASEIKAEVEKQVKDHTGF